MQTERSKLVVEIDCGESGCGRCLFRRRTGWVRCSLFGKTQFDLNHEGWEPQRCDECHVAELGHYLPKLCADFLENETEIDGEYVAHIDYVEIRELVKNLRAGR
jgi:hypothetical protein